MKVFKGFWGWFFDAPFAGYVLVALGFVMTLVVILPPIIKLLGG
jgi:hypothetical protein